MQVVGELTKSCVRVSASGKEIHVPSSAEKTALPRYHYRADPIGVVDKCLARRSKLLTPLKRNRITGLRTHEGKTCDSV